MLDYIVTYFILDFLILCVLYACTYVHHVHAWFLRGSEERVGLPGTRVTGEAPCGSWQLNPNPIVQKISQCL